MKELSEQNFSEVQNSKAALVFFYREKGCSFCDQMKPVMEQYEKDRSMIDVYWYKLGQAPDTITKDLVQKFPTIVAFKDGQMVGKLEGVQSIEALDNIDRPKPVKIEEAAMAQLLVDEAALIDQIVPLKQMLVSIQAEIKRRRELV